MHSNSLVERARRFAAQRHRHQIRKGDGKPFIVHPEGVARWLARAGMPAGVVAAGLLHDVLEDTPTTPQELKQRFGSQVAGWVAEVTESPKRVPWEKRKAAYLAHLRRASREALAISCADKLHNARAILTAYRKEGPIVFHRFNRGIEQKLAQERRVYGVIQKRWPACPLLPPLDQTLKQLETIARRHLQVPPFTEIEAKFLIKNALLLRRIAQLKRIGRFRVARTSRELQRNTYLDTDDFQLKRARAVLKLREIGRRRVEVGFKQELRYKDGVSERLEISRLIHKKQIPLLYRGELRLDPVRRAKAIAGDTPLKNRLTFQTDRQRRILVYEEERVELDIDRVTVRNPRGSEKSFSEIEVENRGASPQHFRQVIEWLKDRYGPELRLSRISKYQRAFRLMAKTKR